MFLDKPVISEEGGRKRTHSKTDSLQKDYPSLYYAKRVNNVEIMEYLKQANGKK